MTVLTICRDELERRIAFLIDGEEVGRTNYDQSGWSGMEDMEHFAIEIARVSGMAVIEKDWDDAAEE